MTDARPSRTGGCDCGAVRYDIKAAPGFAFFCQCRACQRMTGAGHSAGLFVNREALAVDGKLQYWARTADSGKTVTTFRCAICGCPIYSAPGAMPDKVAIAASSLDEPGGFIPQEIVHNKSAQPWDTITLPPHGDAK